MIRWNLNVLIARYNSISNDKLTVRRLASETGLSPTTIQRIASGKAKGIDLATLDALLLFFSKSFQSVGVEDLLVWDKKE